MDRTLVFISVSAFLASIGCGGGGGATDAGTQSGACGISGPTAGSECHSLAECGAGMLNSRTTTFCEHCFAFGDTHLCEAGKCRMLAQPVPDTNIDAAFI